MRDLEEARLLVDAAERDVSALRGMGDAPRPIEVAFPLERMSPGSMHVGNAEFVVEYAWDDGGAATGRGGRIC